MKTRLISLITLLVVASPALAADWLCTNGNAEREIRVQYENPGQPVPCMVVYEKRTEGDTQYPWNAKNQAGYCEEKADYLKERLAGFGWQCVEKSAE